MLVMSTPDIMPPPPHSSPPPPSQGDTVTCPKSHGAKENFLFGYRVVVVEWSGFGSSTYPPPPFPPQGWGTLSYVLGRLFLWGGGGLGEMCVCVCVCVCVL